LREAATSDRKAEVTVRVGPTVILAAAALLSGAAPASAAIFNVDSTADVGDATPDGTCGTGPGTCTLREAVDEANFVDGDDVVNLPANTYKIVDDTPDNEDANAGGDFDVTDANNKLTIDGNAASDTVVDGDDLDRLFDIRNSSNLELVDLTATDGTAGSGGGIQVDGFPSSLALTRATVSNNLATSSGGGIYLTSGSALTTLDALTATDSTIADNDAASGAGIYNTSSDGIALTDTAVTGNDATGSGGGLNLTGSEGLTLMRTTVSGNTAGNNGAGMNNSSDSDPETLTNSTIADNTAANNGGGIYHTASGGPASGLVLNGTTVSGNTATAQNGGGIYHTGSPISLTNSTFSGNTAPSTTPGLGRGGGIHHTGGALSVTHVTFSDNSASQGGAINHAALAPETTLKSTILAAGSSGGACGGGPPTSAGTNIDSDGTCSLAGPGDRPGVDPRLGPLAPNGGSTMTHALLAGSPAIDTADPATCPATDQRGVTRPQGAGCDVGAFEATPEAQQSTPTPTPTQTAGTTQAPANPLLDPQGCLNARGGVRGKQLGPARLGRTKSAQRALLRGGRLRSRKGLDRYCATGGGAFRIGYPSSRLNRAIGRQLRRRVRNRVVLILTSSSRFSVQGVRAGDSVRSARRRIRGERRIRVGSNVWYVARGRGVRVLVSTRGRSVRSVGIGDERLSRGVPATKAFLRAWELG
jgi:CSLREA domain-containing protein